MKTNTLKGDGGKLYLTVGFLLAVLVASHVQGSIFGDGNPVNGLEDDRQLTVESEHPAVGTIQCGNIVRGTGSLLQLDRNTGVAGKAGYPAIVLTAAHVLVDQRTGVQFQDCRFHPSNSRFHGIPFKRISQSDYQFEDINKLQQSAADFIFIELQWNPPLSGLPLNKIQKVTVVERSSSDSLQLIGYHADIDALAQSGNCSLFPNNSVFSNSDLLLHNCDAEGGASGGPLLAEIKNQLYIVGVHGGALLLDSRAFISEQKEFKADPSQHINEARMVNDSLLSVLDQFLTKSE